jgi:DNA-binding Lrp family transcriptional regulator
MVRKQNLIDGLDFLIIQKLHDNARTPAVDIARELSINERTIRKRINRLVDAGFIRLTAIIDPDSVGYYTAVDIFLEEDIEMESEIICQLMTMPEVTYIALGQGTNELSIEARFKTNEDMRDFLGHTLPDIPGLTVTRSALVPRILRNIDEWMPKKEDFLT